MTDEAFHLTPLDVRRWDFGSALRGYDKARVDDLREKVAEELERLMRANQELEAKARGFHEQLRAFRERDKALNDALVSAQQLRVETRVQAEREAELILREARSEAEHIVDDARGEARRLLGELEALERARRAFIIQMRGILERHAAELDAAESAGSAGHDTVQSVSQAMDRGDHGHPRRSAQTPAWLDTVKKE